MQIPVLSGIYTDGAPDFRTSYPRNMIPVPKEQGISKGYLRPADGIVELGTGPGIDRGGINWNGVMYRVMGTSLVKVAADGIITTLGDVGSGGTVSMDYGFDRLAIWSGGRLYYWDGATLTQVIDPDLGNVIDGKWVAGYYMSTDGTYLIVTELNDPTAINPLKYGSAESDPDPIMAIDERLNEVYAFGRYTIEVYQNIGGTLFPFQRIEGAQVGRGIIGTHAYCEYLNSFAFVGSGKNEAPAVHLMAPGDTQKISTREIDQILLQYREEELAAIVVEARATKDHQHLLIHLPDQTLVYDAAASQAVGEPVWFTLTSSILGNGTYRARNLVWCYDTWIAGDPTSSKIGQLVDTVSTHYGDTIGWEFGTHVLYAEGNGAIIHELELVCLPGRVALGADPVIWTSYSLDGETWSQERAKHAGKQGERNKRIAWRKQGKMSHWRIQRFRGTSDAHLSIVRLEAAIEPLFTRPASA
jgi:hypothetical protein